MRCVFMRHSGLAHRRDLFQRGNFFRRILTPLWRLCRNSLEEKTQKICHAMPPL